MVINKRGDVGLGYQSQYFEVVRSEIAEHSVITTDIYLSLAWMAAQALNADQFPIAAKIVQLAARLAIPASGAAAVPSAALLYYCFIYHQRIGDFAAAEREARDLISFVGNEEKRDGLIDVGDAAIRKMIRDKVRLFLSDRARYEPFVNPYRDIGRNQRVTIRYGDGAPIVLKFKQVERDLALGKCELLSTASPTALSSL